MSMTIIRTFVRRARRLASRHLDARRLVLAVIVAGASIALTAVTASADSHDHRHAGHDRDRPPAHGVAQRNDSRAHIADSFRGQGLPASVSGPLNQTEGAAASQAAADLVSGPVGRGAVSQLNAARANATDRATAVSPSRQASRFAGVAVEDSISQTAGAAVAQGGANAVANPDSGIRGAQVVTQRNVVAADAGNVLNQRFLFVTRPGASAAATSGVTVTVDNDVTQFASAAASQSAANAVDDSQAGSGRVSRRIAQSNIAVATVRNVITQLFVFIRTGTGAAQPAGGPLDLVVHNSVFQSGIAGVTQVAGNAAVAPAGATSLARGAFRPVTQLNRAVFAAHNTLSQLFVFDLTGRRSAAGGTVTFDNTVSQTDSLGLTQVATNTASSAAAGRVRRHGTLTQGNLAAATVVNRIVQVFVFLLP